LRTRTEALAKDAVITFGTSSASLVENRIYQILYDFIYAIFVGENVMKTDERQFWILDKLAPGNIDADRIES
jgi:hypothetical protein